MTDGMYLGPKSQKAVAEWQAALAGWPEGGGLSAQLDRIEAKLDRLLALLEPKRKPGRPPKGEADYPVDFEEIWQIYPRRAGSNPKRRAWMAFTARQKDGENVSIMKAGVVAYRAYCGAVGLVGTSYVMQASRFFGREREYLNDWTPPEGEPKTEQEWLAAGKRKGIEPRPAETWESFKSRVRG